MQYKTINLKGREPGELTTEVMFEIASARADGEELVKFNIPSEEALGSFYKKNLNELKRTFKKMKTAGQIQLFAMKSSFVESSTEAIFLMNKYPTVFEDSDFLNEDGYILVKI